MTVIHSYPDAIQPERFEEQCIWLGKEILEELGYYQSIGEVCGNTKKRTRSKKNSAFCSPNTSASASRI